MSESEQGKGKLTFVVGLPRSGKSTYCDRWARYPDLEPTLVGDEEAADQPYKVVTPRVVIGGDDFRTALHGNAYRVEAEGTVFAMMDVAVRGLLNRGFDVIVDETCTTEQTLLRYLRIDGEAVPVFIDTPMETCIERALASDKPFLVAPIKRMAFQLEYLRGNWDIIVGRLKHYLDNRKAQDIPC